MAVSCPGSHVSTPTVTRGSADTPARALHSWLQHGRTHTKGRESSQRSGLAPVPWCPKSFIPGRTNQHSQPKYTGAHPTTGGSPGTRIGPATLFPELPEAQSPGIRSPAVLGAGKEPPNLRTGRETTAAATRGRVSTHRLDCLVQVTTDAGCHRTQLGHSHTRRCHDAHSLRHTDGGPVALLTRIPWGAGAGLSTCTHQRGSGSSTREAVRQGNSHSPWDDDR